MGQMGQMVFAQIVNGWKSWNIFGKHSILDVWQGSEYASGHQTDILR